MTVSAWNNLNVALESNRLAKTPVLERFATTPRAGLLRSRALRYGLRATLGRRFTATAETLHREGVVVLENVIDDELLADLRRLFERGAASKTADPLLGQLSFNGAVDSYDGDLQALAQLATDPLIRLLAADGLGNVPRLSNWRGYRLEPREPILYRAWDWHVDQKRAEIKAMVLLTDVPRDGQPMQYIPGSHRRAWCLSRQSETKFDMDEALLTGDRASVISCHGPAGTVVVFESTGVHRGMRSMTARRDVITVSFVPRGPDAPIFPGRLADACGAAAGQGGLSRATLEKAARTRHWPSVAIVSAAVSAGPAVRRRLSRTHPVAREMTTGQLQRCRDNYAATPRYPDVKPRLRDAASLGEFVGERPTLDLLADLDLPLWPGATDVARDIQLVKLRDAARDDPSLNELSRRFCRDVAIAPAASVDASELQDGVHRVGAAVQAALQQASMARELAPVGELMRDLCIAAGHVDSFQRARTTLAYAVANGADCLLRLRSHSDGNAMARLDDAVDQAANLYLSLVALEDLGLGSI